jgi:chemotaxis regulatin CheY-phosphate phosphatase CheZ
MTEARLITVPARAREEIGELAFYLEQGLRSLRDITEHLRGSSDTVPSVLDDLRAVMRMTEAATMRVLDETEALVDDGHAAARLLADVHAKVGATHSGVLAAPMRELGVLVDRSNSRAMEIMAALEFQDVSNQKVQRTFAVLEEVLVRLAKIQRLVDTGDDALVPASPTGRPVAHDSKAGQRLADELTLHFATQMDV